MPAAAAAAARAAASEVGGGGGDGRTAVGIVQDEIYEDVMETVINFGKVNSFVESLTQTARST